MSDLDFEKHFDNAYCLRLPDIGLTIWVGQMPDGKWRMDVDERAHRSSLVSIRDEYFLDDYDTAEIAMNATRRILALIVEQKSIELSFLAKRLGRYQECLTNKL